MVVFEILTNIPSNSRNIGIKNTTADYIMFLDSDDEYYPKTCETMYKAILKYNSDIVICKYINYVNDSQFHIVESPLMDKAKNIVNIDADNISPLIRAYYMVWNKIFKKSVIIENSISFPNTLLEDVYFSLEYYLNVEKICVLDEFIGYQYDNTPNTTGSTYTQELFEKYFEGYILLMDLLKKENPRYDNKLFSFRNILIVGLMKNLFFIYDIDENMKDNFLNHVKPYLKSYNLFTRLEYYPIINNICLNIIIKLSSCSKIFPKSLYEIFHKKGGGHKLQFITQRFKFLRNELF